jgi:hypothetical protein
MSTNCKVFSIVMRLVLSVVMFVALSVTTSVETASAQGGGFDGGGGGGKMVPDQDEDGPALSEVFSDGVKFLADGKCKEAEDKFEFVLKKVPRNSQANYLRGIALQCQHRYKSSIRYFRIAKRDDAQFYQAYGGLGISYLVLGKSKKAHAELRQLERYMNLCQRKNRRCPPELLKAYKKLATAIERAEGGVPDSKGDDRHGLLFGPDTQPRTIDFANCQLPIAAPITLWPFDQNRVNPDLDIERSAPGAGGSIDDSSRLSDSELYLS